MLSSFFEVGQLFVWLCIFTQTISAIQWLTYFIIYFLFSASVTLKQHHCLISSRSHMATHSSPDLLRGWIQNLWECPVAPCNGTLAVDPLVLWVAGWGLHGCLNRLESGTLGFLKSPKPLRSSVCSILGQGWGFWMFRIVWSDAAAPRSKTNVSYVRQ